MLKNHITVACDKITQEIFILGDREITNNNLYEIQDDLNNYQIVEIKNSKVIIKSKDYFFSYVHYSYLGESKYPIIHNEIEKAKKLLLEQFEQC